MNKNRKLWIGVISLLLAGLLFTVLLMIQSSMNKEPVYVEVLRVKNEISRNTQIAEENFAVYLEKTKVPEEWLPEGYLVDEKQVYNRVFQSDVSKGSIVTESMAEAYESLYEDYGTLTWISIPVKELYQGVAGSLRAGDYIDIYLLREENEVFQCSILAERIRIDATYNEQGSNIPENSKEGLSQLLVIPMEKSQVAVFFENMAQGNIRIAKYEGL